MLGTYALSAGYYDAYYGKAQKVRTPDHPRLRRGVRARSTSCCRPTSPTPAFRIGEKTDDPLAMYLSTSSRSRRTSPASPASASRAAGRRRRCRSACSSSRPRSTRRRCCARPHALELRISTWTCGRAARERGAEHRRRLTRAVDRPRGARRAVDARPRCSAACPNAFGAEPNTNIVPGLPRAAGHAAGARTEQAVELACARRWRSTARSRRTRSSTGRTTSTRTCRRTTRSASTTCRSASAVTSTSSWPTADHAVGITRAHIEEDTGKTHARRRGGPHPRRDPFLVDYNRAGVPLVEIVSEPDIRIARAGRARTCASCARSLAVARRVAT